MIFTWDALIVTIKFWIFRILSQIDRFRAWVRKTLWHFVKSKCMIRKLEIYTYQQKKLYILTRPQNAQKVQFFVETDYSWSLSKYFQA